MNKIIKELQCRDKVEEILKLAHFTDEAIEKAFHYIYSDNWSTIDEIINKLGVTRRTINKWILQGKVKSLKLPKTMLISEKEIR